VKNAALGKGGKLPLYFGVRWKKVFRVERKSIADVPDTERTMGDRLNRTRSQPAKLGKEERLQIGLYAMEDGFRFEKGRP